jgi:hypothetical protein
MTQGELEAYPDKAGRHPARQCRPFEVSRLRLRTAVLQAHQRLLRRGGLHPGRHVDQAGVPQDQARLRAKRPQLSVTFSQVARYLGGDEGSLTRNLGAWRKPLIRALEAFLKVGSIKLSSIHQIVGRHCRILRTRPTRPRRPRSCRITGRHGASAALLDGFVATIVRLETVKQGFDPADIAYVEGTWGHDTALLPWKRGFVVWLRDGRRVRIESSGPQLREPQRHGRSAMTVRNRPAACRRRRPAGRAQGVVAGLLAN